MHHSVGIEIVHLRSNSFNPRCGRPIITRIKIKTPIRSQLQPTGKKLTTFWHIIFFSIQNKHSCWNWYHNPITIKTIYFSFNRFKTCNTDSIIFRIKVHFPTTKLKPSCCNDTIYKIIFFSIINRCSIPLDYHPIGIKNIFFSINFCNADCCSSIIIGIKIHSHSHKLQPTVLFLTICAQPVFFSINNRCPRNRPSFRIKIVNFSIYFFPSSHFYSVLHVIPIAVNVCSPAFSGIYNSQICSNSFCISLPKAL